MKSKNSITLLLLMVVALHSKAQQAPLRLSDVIALSLQNNYDIQLTRSDSVLAALDVAYANYALYPTLNATGGLVYNNGTRNEIRGNGDKGEGQIKTNNLTASLNLNWTLFDGLRMFIARERLSKVLSLSELQVKGQVINTVAEVMRTYFDIVRLEQQLKTIEEQIGLSQERLKLAQYKFEVGTGAKPDVLQAQVDLNAQLSARLTQQVTISNRKQQLAQLLVLPIQNDIALADTSITYNAALILDSITAGINTTNPDLLINQKNLDLAQLDLRLRRAERFPTLEFNSSYNFTRTANNAIVNPVQQNQLLQTRGLNYGFTATIPIFNGFSNRRQIKAAQINIETQKLLYDRTLALLNTSIINAYRDYDLSKRSLALEETNISLVRENLFIARERYRLGVTTFIELREAEQSLAEAENRLIGARYNIKLAEIELLRLRGDLVR